MAQTKKKGKNTRKNHKRTAKAKTYIAPYKVIIFCMLVITVCMLLLFITNIMPQKKSPLLQEETQTKVTEQSDKNSQKQSESIAQAEASSQVTEAPKVADSSKTASTPKAETSSQVADSSKTTNTQKAEASSQVAASSKKESSSKKEASSQAETSTQIASSPQALVSSTKIDSQSIITKNEGFNFPNAKMGAQIVLVMDDGGHNLNHLKKFLDLPIPLTIAVLPKLTYSKESARLIRNSNKELMLHQPMQAVNPNVNPGPGAITPNMSDEEIISTLFQNITEIGPISGFNNHEGSAITADAEKMEVILRIASQEGIYFLDSRTNVQTKVPYVAREMGYSWYERNIFLDNNFQENKFEDNDKTRLNFLTELKKGLDIANKNGSVIMIGHIWSAELLPKLLMEAYPELQAKGYTFSLVSKSKAKKS